MGGGGGGGGGELFTCPNPLTFRYAHHIYFVKFRVPHSFERAVPKGMIKLLTERGECCGTRKHTGQTNPTLPLKGLR